MRRRGRVRLSYVVALTAFGGGAWISAITGDWGWFSRSGSLVVAVGILLTSTQILEHDRRMRRRRLRLEARLRRDSEKPAVDSVPPSSRDWARDADSDAASDDESTWLREHDGLHLLIAGTLVWGFGDLLGGFFD